MAESTHSLTFDDLGISTSHYLGWGRMADEDDGLTAAQAANVLAANRVGYRDFIAAHDWSFLRPRRAMTLWSTKTGTVTATFSTPTSTVTATAPKFFASMIGHELLIERITNGDFDTDTDWTKGAGWTISGGVAVATGAISTDLSQASTVIVGTTYRVTYTLSSVTAGSITPNCGTTTGSPQTEDGTYTEDIVCAGSTTFKFSTSGFTGHVDDVSVQSVNTITAYTSTTVISVSGNCTATALAFEVTADGVYRLPDDYGSMRSTEISFEAGNNDDRKIVMTTEKMVVDAWQVDESPGRPTIGGIRPLLNSAGTTGQRFDLVVAKIPDVDYLVSFQFEVHPDALTTGLYPYGGMKYAEALRKCCLAAAESMFNDHQTIKREESRLALQRAIQDDTRSNRSDRLGRAYPRQARRGRYPEISDEWVVAGTVNGVDYNP